jgi:hypothetical protein
MVGKRYAIADLHGQLCLFNKVKEYIDDNDIVYALGDFGDRGYEPWRTLKAVLDDPQFVYLMGNHDKMLIDGIKSTLKHMKRYGDVPWTAADVPYEYTGLLAINGGWETLLGWANEPNRMEYYMKLMDLPIQQTLCQRYTNNMVILSHAGYTPGNKYHVHNLDNLLWDRNHIVDDWPENYDYDDVYVIHGHTCKQYLGSYINYKERENIDLHKPGAVWYANNHKCCLDMGSIVSWETVLLDLDTFEEHIITIPEEERMEILPNTD